MQKIVVVIVLILGLVPLKTIADASLADLSNDKVLEGAVAEVHSMKARELEVAIEFISACMEPPSPERNYHCNRSFTIASIKIERAPQFSKLSKSIFLAEIKNQGEKVKGSMESIGAHMMEIRRSEIFSKLQDAAHERYQELAK
jgi:hypothetical protein